MQDHFYILILNSRTGLVDRIKKVSNTDIDRIKCLKELYDVILVRDEKSAYQIRDILESTK